MVLKQSLRIIFLTIVIIPYVHINARRIIKASDIVSRINNDPLSTWQAHDYGNKEYDVKEFKRSKLGTIMKPKSKHFFTRDQMLKLAKAVPSNTSFPVNFTWANKTNTDCPVDNIRDQANCGSCWAVATASALSDRFCIQTKGKIRIPLSQEYITACDRSNFGCRGGYMERVNEFTKNGIVTGGEYESDDGCQMYTIRSCRYSKMPCVGFSRTPKCRAKKCNNEWYEYKTEPDKYTYRTSNWYFLEPNGSLSVEEKAMQEIMENGPITAGFLVKIDFIFYKKGVYIPSPNAYYIGGHAVRVVGWGIENGVKYWHVANSWSKDWGENGFFKIVRGVNACYFEDELSVLVPLIKN